MASKRDEEHTIPKQPAVGIGRGPQDTGEPSTPRGKAKSERRGGGAQRTAQLLLASLCWMAGQASAAELTSQAFVDAAGTSGLAEVAASTMALQQSSDADVKQFAEMMIADHKKASAELQALAKSASLTPPSEPTSAQKQAAAKLKSETGVAFDRAYARQMVEDHEKAVSLFRQAAHGSDIAPALRSFAEKTLPTLEHHLEEARDLASDVASR